MNAAKTTPKKSWLTFTQFAPWEVPAGVKPDEVFSEPEEAAFWLEGQNFKIQNGKIEKEYNKSHIENFEYEVIAWLVDEHGYEANANLIKNPKPVAGLHAIDGLTISHVFSKISPPKVVDDQEGVIVRPMTISSIKTNKIKRKVRSPSPSANVKEL